MSEAMTADDKPTERIIKLAPIGPDGRCTGCGAVPTRETGRCQCYTGPATRVPDDLCSPYYERGWKAGHAVASADATVTRDRLAVHCEGCNVHNICPGLSLADAPAVEAAWEALTIELDEPQPGMTSWGSVQRHRPAIEAAIRAESAETLAALREALGRAESVQRCIFTPCVATWAHSHGGFPGGYDDPADPEGPPIAFVSDDPDPTAVRDYNGAALAATPAEDGEGRT